VGFGSSLIRGLVTDATGINEGQAKRKAVEQQALHEALAQSLLQAQTERALRPPPQRQAASQPKPPAPFRFKGKGGNMYSGTYGPDGTVSIVALPNGDAPPPKVASPKPLSTVDRETNAAGHTALDLIKDMRAAHAANAQSSQLPGTTNILRNVGRLPVIGGAAAGALEPLAQSEMTTEQARYQQKADQLLHLASSILPKGGRSVAILQNLRQSFTAAAGAKNPEAAQEALGELEKQIYEVLGEKPPTAEPPKPVRAPSGPKYKRAQ